jgi:heme exporter protein B
MRAVTGLLLREFRLAMRRRGELAQPLVFFAAVATLFPLAIGPGTAVLARIAPGIVWVAVLLAMLLPLERLFRTDLEDGTLDQLLLSPAPVSLLVLTKVVAHWLVTAVPMIVLAPLVAVFLQLPAAALPVLLATLLLGTPVLALIGAIAAALTAGLRAGGPLLALLLLPLYVPVLIFAAGAVDRAAAGMAVAGPLYFLGGLLVLALTLAPITIAAALRISNA